MKVFRGLLPLILLLGLAAATVALTAAARVMGAQAGFLVWRWLVLGVLAAGMTVAVVVYALMTARALRRSDSAVTLWLLAAGAIPLGAPLLLAILPQH